jgi:hypothetical protein
MNREVKQCTASTKNEMVANVKRQLLTKRLVAPLHAEPAGLQNSAVEEVVGKQSTVWAI